MSDIKTKPAIATGSVTENCSDFSLADNQDKQTIRANAQCLMDQFSKKVTLGPAPKLEWNNNKLHKVTCVASEVVEHVDSQLALYGGLFVFTCSESSDPRTLFIYHVANLYLYEDPESRILPERTTPVMDKHSIITVATQKSE